ncbi:MAG: hypothetical protein AAF467_04690 [Actinomycetota bacterium]
MTQSPLSVLWSVAGGCGVTTVVVAAAAGASPAEPVLIVDVDGAVAPVLGVARAPLGLYDWLAAERPPADAFARLVEIHGAVALLGPGLRALGADREVDQWAPGRLDELVRSLRRNGRRVLVDAGSQPWRHPLARALVDHADASYLVTRLGRPEFDVVTEPSVSESVAAHVDGVIAIVEPGRVLTARDLGRVVGTTTTLSVPWDPAVAAAVDAGSLTRRCPRALRAVRRFVR